MTSGRFKIAAPLRPICTDINSNPLRRLTCSRNVLKTGPWEDFKMSHHGLPCWYELTAADPAASAKFYAGLFGWTWAEANVPGMDYRLASAGPTMIAGMMKAEPGQPLAWMIYIAVDDCDATVALATSLGSTVIVPPADIPGTGRFSIFLDPQGAGIGILQPLPMAEDSTGGGAFDQLKMGHGNWHEMVSPNPAAALEFYGKLFGWTLSRAVPMGPDMIYNVYKRGNLDIGGMFTDGATVMWKPYFGTDSAKGSIAKIPALGGTVLHGPDEVPGGAFTVQLKDPQGTVLAVVGPA
jgi:hypothetical protein